MMKCPVDDTELTMSDRQGIEIDYCPKCRGVWLDRGELDKIIERTDNSAQSRNDRNDQNEDPRDRRRNDRNQDDEEEGGFLGNLFGGFGGRDD